MMGWREFLNAVQGGAIVQRRSIEPLVLVQSACECEREVLSKRSGERGNDGTTDSEK